MKDYEAIDRIAREVPADAAIEMRRERSVFRYTTGERHRYPGRWFLAVRRSFTSEGGARRIRLLGIAYGDDLETAVETLITDYHRRQAQEARRQARRKAKEAARVPAPPFRFAC